MLVILLVCLTLSHLRIDNFPEDKESLECFDEVISLYEFNDRSQEGQNADNIENICLKSVFFKPCARSVAQEERQDG